MASRCLLSIPTTLEADSPPRTRVFDASLLQTFHFQHRWLFAPTNHSEDGFESVMYASQFRASCDRFLVVADDLTKAGLGFTSKIWAIALQLAVRDNRILIEAPARTPHGRWCDRPPYTLQCLYQPWTHCNPPHASVLDGVHHRWPEHASSIARTSLGAIYRKGLYWHGAHSRAEKAAARLLFRPRAWVRALAECVMSDAGLRPRRFLSVHIRNSPEKRDEAARHAFALPESESYAILAAAVAADLQLKRVFVQVASPSELRAFVRDLSGGGALAVHYTNNSRSEHDAWGGWQAGVEMEQALIAAVNAYIGTQAAASISPEVSMWTPFLGWLFGASDGGAGTSDGKWSTLLAASRLCCPASSSTCRSVNGRASSSHVLQLLAESSLLRGGRLLATRARCRELAVLIAPYGGQGVERVCSAPLPLRGVPRCK